jgi:Mn-dependent DtxR family transcriptional regulator
VVLLVIYCHGWEFEATVSRVKRISRRFCVETLDIIIEDLKVMGLVIEQDRRLVLTRKGLSIARRTCERCSNLCSEIERVVWSETSKQLVTLKRFARR